MERQGLSRQKEMMRKQILEGDIIRTTLALSWPVMLSNAFQTIYNLTDAFWLGKLGPEALAAPSISWPIMFLLMPISGGFCVAGLSMVSQYVGAGDIRSANKATGQMLSILLWASISVAFSGFFLAETILRLINVPEGVLRISASYLRITFLGVPFMFMSFGFQSLMRGYGDTKTPMILSISSAVLDTILDPFFAFGWLGLPTIGASGAALTTVMTRGLAGMIGMYLLLTGKVGVKLSREDLMPDPKLIKKIAVIGLPSSIGQSGTALGFTVIMSLVSTADRTRGGTGLLLSAYGIGSRISSLIQIVIIGGVTALSTMVGQNIGANQVDRVNEIVKKLFIFFVGLSVVKSTIIYFLRVPLYHFFIADPTVISLGSTYMTYFAPFFPFFTVFQLCSRALQAAGKTKVSMALSLIRLWVLRILLSYVIYYILKMGVNGIWLGFAIGNVASTILAMV
jgi:putative MATE family efflux protein